MNGKRKNRLIKDPERIAFAIAEDMYPGVAGKLTSLERNVELMEVRAGIARGLHGIGYMFEGIAAAMQRSLRPVYQMVSERPSTAISRRVTAAIMSRCADFVEEAPRGSQQSPSGSSSTYGGTLMCGSGAIYRRDSEGKLAFREDNDPHKRYLGASR